MKTSLIISVYKNVRDLHVVLEGLKFQTYKDFEIVISEDGEFEGMKEFIQQYSHPNPIIHLTQPDVGWRKNQALNNAIRKSSGDYLIFIDGDCVLHHKFIENHIRYARPDRIIAGKRIKMGQHYSDQFRDHIQDLPLLERRIQRQGREVIKDGGKFYEEALYINPDSWLGIIPRLRGMYQLKGCNMSFFRDAIEKINGFDEDYVLPAIGEDIDLTWRFLGLGYTLFSVRNLAVQYHLYHKENWSDQIENQRIMDEKKALQKFVCSNGLAKPGTLNGTRPARPSFADRKPRSPVTGKVLLLEFKYHQEIIPSQILMLLEAGYEVHLILNERLWDEQLLGRFRGSIHVTLLPKSNLLPQKIISIFKIRKYIRANGIEYMVLNTLDSNFNYFLLQLNPSVHAIGIVHQVHRFVTRKMHRSNLRLIKGVATLSTYTLSFFKNNFEYPARKACFYPIFFDESTANAERLDNDEIRIVVPGQIDLKKRDYHQLITTLEKYRDDNFNGVKLFLLGNIRNNDGPEVLETIRKKGLERFFFWKDEFIPYKDFFSILQNCDYVLPLLSRAVNNHDHYLQSQISASFNWAYAFKKKLLVHTEFKSIVETNNAIFYSDEDFFQILSSLERSSGGYHIPRHFEFRIQQEAYLSLFEKQSPV
jgi:GT2 family glycosyltransferase